MIEYVINNKEWIFSGVGVFILGLIGTIILKRKHTESYSLLTEKIIYTQSKEQSDLNQVRNYRETEAGKISKRFSIVLDLMNEGMNYSQFTISQLAQIMNLNKVSELEHVFLGEKEPTFKFIDKYCETFGVNKKWLMEGKEFPFSNNELAQSNPLWNFEDIKEIDPERIFFVRANTETAQAFILLKIADWKFKILHKTWHISDHVGGGGQSQLFGFYKLIIKLRDESKFSAKCSGLTLNKIDFDTLYIGDKFPGMFVNRCKSADY